MADSRNGLTSTVGSLSFEMPDLQILPEGTSKSDFGSVAHIQRKCVMEDKRSRNALTQYASMLGRLDELPCEDVKRKTGGQDRN